MSVWLQRWVSCSLCVAAPAPVEEALRPLVVPGPWALTPLRAEPARVREALERLQARWAAGAGAAGRLACVVDWNLSRAAPGQLSESSGSRRPGPPAGWAWSSPA